MTTATARGLDQPLAQLDVVLDRLALGGLLADEGAEVGERVERALRLDALDAGDLAQARLTMALRRLSNSTRIFSSSSVGPSMAASAAACATDAAWVVDCPCSVAIASTTGFGADREADAPPGHRERLRDAVDDDRVRPHLGADGRRLEELARRRRPACGRCRRSSARRLLRPPAWPAPRSVASS